MTLFSMKNKNIFYLIPARAGSKGVINKNSRNIGGKPLICHTLDTVVGLAEKEKIIVSTNCPKIQQICQDKYKDVLTLHKRENSISGDKSPISETVKEIMKTLKGELTNSSLCLLQPTSPLRTRNDIENAINIYRSNNNQNLVSVTRVKHSACPEKLLIRDSNQKATSFQGEQMTIRRQNLSKEYLSRNGAIYISSLATMDKGFIRKSCIYYEMPTWRSIDIDTMEDWRIAEMYLENKSRLELI